MKVKPSLTKARKDLLKSANETLEVYYKDRASLKNPQEFVFADMHGNIKVKMMTKPTKRGMFQKFNSLVELTQIIERCQCT